MKTTFFFLSFIMAPIISWADAALTYHGRIIDNNRRPVESNSVTFIVRILSPDPDNCLLYEESRNIDMRSSDGVFVIPIGDKVIRRTTNDPGIAMEKVFANNSDFTFNTTNTPKLACTSGSTSYTPSALHQRHLYVAFDDHSGTGLQELPLMDISFVPLAMSSHDAQNIGGTPANAVLRLSSGTATPLSPANFSELLDLVNGSSNQYEKMGQLNGANLPVLANGQVLSWSSDSWVPITPMTSYVEADPSVKAFAKSDLPTCGANSFLKDDGNGNLTCASVVGADGKLPVIDGSNLTNVIAAGLSSNASINTSGGIITSTLTAPQINTRNLYIENTTPNRVTLQAPTSFSDYTWTFPTTQGTSGQVLSTNGGGQLQWIPAASVSVTSMTADAPLSVNSSVSSSPKVSIVKADGTHDGYLSKEDWNQFSKKQSNTLNNGKIWVGNASDEASVVAIGGDATLGNDGTLNITKLRGNVVTAGAIPASDVGKVYRWNGSSLTPSFLTFGDLKTITGANQLGTICAANKKIQWSVITDAFTCENIGSLDASAITTGTIASSVLPAYVTRWQDGAAGAVYYSGGNVGIGTASPGAKLDVDGYIRVRSINGEGGTILLDGNNGTNLHLENINGTFRIINNGWGSGIFHVDQSGNVSANGDMNAVGFYYTSDRRLKTDIAPIESALDKVCRIEGVSFSWKKDGRPAIGFIAQDVEQVFPEAVSTNPQTGYKAVQYGNLVAPTIEAVKELNAKVEILIKKVEAQEREIAQMKEKKGACQ